MTRALLNRLLDDIVFAVFWIAAVGTYITLIAVIITMFIFPDEPGRPVR